jgi:hypothetical protein
MTAPASTQADDPRHLRDLAKPSVTVLPKRGGELVRAFRAVADGVQQYLRVPPLGIRRET